MLKTVLMTLLISLTLYAEEMAIAVNDLKGTGLSAGELTIISERLRGELFQTGKYTVMERGEMEAVLKEMEFQMSGACDEASCMVEVGQMLGVRQIVVGSVGKIENFYTISLRAIGVGSGKIEATANHDYTGSISGLISDAIGEVAQKLAGTASSSATKSKTVKKAAAPKPTAVSIATKPSGATLSIGDSIQSTTPYTGTLMPNTYNLSFKLDGYEDLSKKITVGKTTYSSTFKLKELKEKGKDSPRRGTVTRIISGTVAVGALVAGVAFNAKATTHSENSVQQLNEAVNAVYSPSADNAYITEIESAENAVTARNIMYILSGASVTLFAISFAF